MIFLTLVNNIALLVSLSIVHDFIMRRWKKHTGFYQIISGLLFGGVCLIGMMNPLILTPGLIFDGRSIIITIAGLFGGPLTAIITSIIAAIYRINLGGPGAIMGVSVITESAVFGILYHYLRKKDEKFNSPMYLYALGLTVHIVMNILTLALPGKLTFDAFNQVALPVIVIYPVAFVLIALLFLDLEAKMKAEKQLKQSEANFRTLVEQIPQRVFIKDKNSKYILCNKSYALDLKINEEDIKGKDDYAFFPIELAEKYRNDDFRVINNGVEITVEENYISDNSEMIIKTNKVPFRNQDNKIIGVLGIFEDITVRKQIEQQLISAKENAEEMNKLRSNFFANMSHELRTPLNGILGFAEILSQSLIKEEKRNMASMILKSGKRLLNTLNLILNLSKIEANKYELNFTKINLADIVKNSVNLYVYSAKEKNIEIGFSLPNSERYIISDEKIIQSVLDNLVNNAIKYTHKGSVSVSLEYEFHNNQDFAYIKVSDTGIGIDPAYKDIIFEPFRQASEGYGRHFEGTGLGLTITKKNIEMLKGEISCQSQLNIGTTFLIKLPIRFVETDSSANISEIFELSPPTKPISKNTRILCVEDDMISQEFVKSIIQNIYKVDFAINSTVALNKLKVNYYDAIMMDINLKGELDGLQLTGLIRKMPEYRNVPIVAVTAYAMESEKDSILNRGCSHYLSKPYMPQELIQLLESILI